MTEQKMLQEGEDSQGVSAPTTTRSGHSRGADTASVDLEEDWEAQGLTAKLWRLDYDQIWDLLCSCAVSGDIAIDGFFTALFRW